VPTFAGRGFLLGQRNNLVKLGKEEKRKMLEEKEEEQGKR
jgi:hypothetical protein